MPFNTLEYLEEVLFFLHPRNDGLSPSAIRVGKLGSMIVCSCNVFSDRDVRSAIDTAPARPATANQVYGCLGCSPQCGRCARTIRRIMDEALRGARGCAQECPSPARRTIAADHSNRVLPHSGPHSPLEAVTPSH